MGGPSGGQHAPQRDFDRRRAAVGVVAAPLAAAAVLALTGGLEPSQRALAAVVALAVVLWITEPIPIPITAVLSLSLAALGGVAPASQVFGAFSSPVIFLFIGSFILARAMTVHGIDRRFALRVLAIRGVAHSTVRVVIAFGATSALLSAMISNSATVAMLLPIALGVLGTVTELLPEPLRRRPQLRVGTALMLMTAYGASVGGLLTPIGSPPNLIGRAFLADLTGVRIGFLDWMALTAPLVLASFAVLCVALLLLNPPEIRRLDGAAAFVRREREALGPLSRGERNTLVAFATAVLLWLLPGLVDALLGDDAPVAVFLSDRLDEGTVAILAATLLFVLPVDWPARRFTLDWDEAVRIDWGTILLFGCGIALGQLMSDTGLATLLGEGLAAALGGGSLVAFTLGITATSVLMSETVSSTAAVGIVVPVVVSLAEAAGVAPLVPTLAAVLACSYGFMLPVSTPPNAMVYASGLVPITRMVSTGAVVDVAGVLLVSGIMLLTA